MTGNGTTPRSGAQAARSHETLWVGIVWGDRQVTWGLCAAAAVEWRPEYQGPFLAAPGSKTIETIVAPELLGQPLADFPALAEKLEGLTETVTVRREPEPAAEPGETTRGYSRRAIISGFLATDEPDARTQAAETVELSRIIHPAIRLGVSQALLAAIAQSRGLTVAEALIETYGRPPAMIQPPVQLALRRGESFQLRPELGALSLSVGEGEPALELGADAERLQRLVRQFQERLTAANPGDSQPTIHLELNGSLGRLYGNGVGKTLGALYGLERAAAPCRLRVSDPFLLADRADQIKQLSQLQDHLRLRRMEVDLAARAYVDGPEAVTAFLTGGAGRLVHLSMASLGTIHQTVQSLRACREQGGQALLAGAPAEMLAQVALVSQPDFVIVGSDQADLVAVLDEMARTQLWLAVKEAS